MDAPIDTFREQCLSNTGSPADRLIRLGAWAAGKVKAKPVGKDSNPRPLLSGDSPAITRETGAEWDFSPPVAADGFLRPELLETSPRGGGCAISVTRTDGELDRLRAAAITADVLQAAQRLREPGSWLSQRGSSG